MTLNLISVTISNAVGVDKSEKNKYIKLYGSLLLYSFLLNRYINYAYKDNYIEITKEFENERLKTKDDLSLIEIEEMYYKYFDSYKVKYNHNVGLASNSDVKKLKNIANSKTSCDYVFTGTSDDMLELIKNNTNSSIKYSINLKQNDELIKNDNCLESQIPTNIVRLSIHKNGEKNNIYTVSDLVNGHILSRIIKANKSEEYTMRFWTVNNNAIPTGAKLHYHSTIDVVDEGVEIAAVVK